MTDICRIYLLPKTFAVKEVCSQLFHLKYTGKQKQEAGTCYLISKMISLKTFQLRGK